MPGTDETEVMDFLSHVLKDVFHRDITPSAKMKASDVVGWDSIKQVEISLALEEKYNVRIRAKELNNVANVGDLVALVAKKVNSAV